jgi:hypothetical protein
MEGLETGESAVGAWIEMNIVEGLAGGHASSDLQRISLLPRPHSRGDGRSGAEAPRGLSRNLRELATRTRLAPKLAEGRSLRGVQSVIPSPSRGAVGTCFPSASLGAMRASGRRACDDPLGEPRGYARICAIRERARCPSRPAEFLNLVTARGRSHSLKPAPRSGRRHECRRGTLKRAPRGPPE